MTSLREIRRTARQALSESDTAALDVDVLLQHVLQQPRSYLIAHDDQTLSAEQQQQFEQLLKRRQQGEPVAYLTGTQEFWSMSFAVSPAVLIPRPETECLVEATLEQVDQPTANILELGTGSGAIACALAKERPQWEITAIDASEAALNIAQHNAKQLGFTNIRFIQSNWYQNVSALPFDAIVSNPPYIDPADPHLQQGDVRFEPMQALAAAAEGLADITTILHGAAPHLKPNGTVLLEHGYNQKQAVQSLFQQMHFEGIHTLQDLSDLPRVTFGRINHL